MDSSEFDALVSVFPESRRALLGTMMTATIGWLGLAPAGAKKKRRHKRKKRKPAKPNEFGCIEVDDPCRSADDCCSGICEGKEGKRTCHAHDTGTCPQDVPGRCTDPSSVGTCNGNLGCSCFRTTAGSVACLNGARTDFTCADCRTDADCVAFGMPAGSACIPASEGPCINYCGGGPACLAPCGSVITEE